jgi:hypothetical protein
MFRVRGESSSRAAALAENARLGCRGEEANQRRRRRLVQLQPRGVATAAADAAAATPASTTVSATVSTTVTAATITATVAP